MCSRLYRAVWLALSLLRPAACQLELYAPSDQMPLAAVENVTVANCHQACAELRAADRFDLLSHYPDLPPGFQEQYFTNQQVEMIPMCVVRPRSAEAVSYVVKSVREHQCDFAIKSGGHSVAAGTSARHNGLVLDLKHLNQIELSQDRQTVSVGPGNLWRDVYEKLEPEGLLVAGGRVGSVGVGGFTLGGGISFISRRHGWAVDNVRNFQVVLPNGTVTEANPNEHPELFFALRGGGSNFGVVTRFDFEAHAHDLLWGGMEGNIMRDLSDRNQLSGLREQFNWTLHSALTIASGWLQGISRRLGYGAKSHDLINAFVALAEERQTDSAAHSYLYFSWVAMVKAHIVGSTYLYSLPVEEPTVLQNLTSVPSLWFTKRLTRMSEFTSEIEDLNPTGLRNYWRTSTFKVNGELISKLWDIFLAESHSLRLAVPDALISTNLQLLTKHEIGLFSRNGGNAFGIDVEDGPLFFFGITIAWKSLKDDEILPKLAKTVISKAVELGKEMGLHHPFIYPNYAAADQDVFAGYSPRTRQRLLDIQDRYDAGQVFSNLQPEHFRLR